MSVALTNLNCRFGGVNRLQSKAWDLVDSTWKRTLDAGMTLEGLMVSRFWVIRMLSILENSVMQETDRKLYQDTDEIFAREFE